MTTFVKILFIATLFSSTAFISRAQQKTEKFTVFTSLKENSGSYDQRKLYREFLTSYMKDCPYISHFNILEESNATDNHNVVWTYEVNSWDDITKFYGWVNQQLKSKDGGLKKAMTPFSPDYAIGSKIKVEKTNDEAIAGESTEHKNHVKNGG